MEEKKSLQTDYFKHVYEANDDPWNFETSEYEAAKYAATLDALPRKHYENALEIGCSIGVLTKLLAARCHNLLATDVSEKALEKARERCADMDNVKFKFCSFPQELPDDQYDLIMLSEVAYYLSPDDWEFGIKKLLYLMRPTANIVLVHWLPEVPDYPQTGDEVHDRFAQLIKGKMRNVFESRTENYRLDVWEHSAGE